MTPEQFAALSAGDVIAHVSVHGTSYIVTVNYGKRVTAVKTVDATNPSEWRVICKASYRDPGAKEDRVNGKDST